MNSHLNSDVYKVFRLEYNYDQMYSDLNTLWYRTTQAIRARGTPNGRLGSHVAYTRERLHTATGASPAPTNPPVAASKCHVCHLL